MQGLPHTSAKCPPGLGAIADQIAGLAGIAEEQRPLLPRSIAELIDSFNDDEPLSKDDQREGMRLVDQLRDRQIRMLRARRAVRETATELCAAIEDYDQAYGKETRIDEMAPAEIDRPLRDVLDLLNREPPIARYLISHRRGRPAGQINHPDAVQFLMCPSSEILRQKAP